MSGWEKILELIMIKGFNLSEIYEMKSFTV